MLMPFTEYIKTYREQ